MRKVRELEFSKFGNQVLSTQRLRVQYHYDKFLQFVVSLTEKEKSEKCDLLKARASMEGANGGQKIAWKTIHCVHIIYEIIERQFQL